MCDSRSCPISNSSYYYSCSRAIGGVDGLACMHVSVSVSVSVSASASAPSSFKSWKPNLHRFLLILPPP
ncbi:predicted protein [Botrytis cinerea T4]|uniref:Uncharacterized protein n=1 Tax=Botryotinia fuckeliana (strain T4) TaxID=999810 RepID=G2YZ17_BOTF4|nr:predicted protein [Botrytis cinerea T4]